MSIAIAKLDRIQAVIADQFGIELSTITPESNLQNDLHGDSLDLMEIVMELENEFGIEIVDTDAEACKTVQDLYNVVERLTD